LIRSTRVLRPASFQSLAILRLRSARRSSVTVRSTNM